MRKAESGAAEEAEPSSSSPELETLFQTRTKSLIKPILRVRLVWNRGGWSSIHKLVLISKILTLDYMYVRFMTMYVYVVVIWK